MDGSPEPAASALDAIVIGGGVVGTGVARDLAMRGYACLLLEKRDFGAGTSGASTGMIHGGIRYLEKDARVTKLSCTDAGYIRKIASHLTYRIPMLFPTFHSGMAGDVYETLFLAYDEYVHLKDGKPHVRLSDKEALALEPGLAPGVTGAVTCDEWGIDAPRLCVLNARSAMESGARIAAKAEVVEFMRDGARVTGVRYRQSPDRALREANAPVVVNCAGPWVEALAGLAGQSVRMRPTKGVHLVYDRQVARSAVISETVDGRHIFIVPHQNMTLVGPTDDDFYGNLDDLDVTADEVGYLLQSALRVMPGLARARLVTTTVGVRPTLFGWGVYEDGLSREYEIIDHESRGAPGLITVAGGKLAMYRKMAQDAVDAVARRLGARGACRTGQEPLPGAEVTVSSPRQAKLAQKVGLSTYAVKRMVDRHGSRVELVLDVVSASLTNRDLACPCEPVTVGELRHVIRHEWATTLADLSRRTHILTGGCQGAPCALRAMLVLGEELGLSAAEMRRAMIDWLREDWGRRAPVMVRAEAAQQEAWHAMMASTLGLDGEWPWTSRSA